METLLLNAREHAGDSQAAEATWLGEFRIKPHFGIDVNKLRIEAESSTTSFLPNLIVLAAASTAYSVSRFLSATVLRRPFTPGVNQSDRTGRILPAYSS